MAAPRCIGMAELPTAFALRAQLAASPATLPPGTAHHLRQGLALTPGAALGATAPTRAQCLASFAAPNRVGLTAGARAWQKHAHRSGAGDASAATPGWWGLAHGSVGMLNERALTIFERVMDGATWRNLHWLPHAVLVYEVRVPEGYGMRWSQDRSALVDVGDTASALAPPEHPAGEGAQVVATPPQPDTRPEDITSASAPPEPDAVSPTTKEPALPTDAPLDAPAPPASATPAEPPWLFRGLVEPMMPNGHEVHWRH